jgi:hypothetical protein
MAPLGGGRSAILAPHHRVEPFVPLRQLVAPGSTTSRMWNWECREAEPVFSGPRLDEHHLDHVRLSGEWAGLTASATLLESALTIWSIPSKPYLVDKEHRNVLPRAVRSTRREVTPYVWREER